MTLSKFSEIKEMANLMSDEDIKFAETFLRNIQTEVEKSWKNLPASQKAGFVWYGLSLPPALYVIFSKPLLMETRKTLGLILSWSWYGPLELHRLMNLDLETEKREKNE